jgi:DNA-binding NarL/FixJ family response regulator
MTDTELGAFLSASASPEHKALLRLIGASILNPRGGEADDEPAAANTGKDWSDRELTELGEMLVRGLSTEEIARHLRRGHGDVRDKVAEVGRACR